MLPYPCLVYFLHFMHLYILVLDLLLVHIHLVAAIHLQIMSPFDFRWQTVTTRPDLIFSSFYLSTLWKNLLDHVDVYNLINLCHLQMKVYKLVVCNFNQVGRKVVNFSLIICHCPHLLSRITTTCLISWIVLGYIGLHSILSNQLYQFLLFELHTFHIWFGDHSPVNYLGIWHSHVRYNYYVFVFTPPILFFPFSHF